MEWDLSKYTNTFIFFLQEILAVINIMGRWQSQRHYLLWPCPRSIVFFKWWEPSMRNAMCLCVLALPRKHLHLHEMLSPCLSFCLKLAQFCDNSEISLPKCCFLRHGGIKVVWQLCLVISYFLQIWQRTFWII